MSWAVLGRSQSSDQKHVQLESGGGDVEVMVLVMTGYCVGEVEKVG